MLFIQVLMKFFLKTITILSMFLLITSFIEKDENKLKTGFYYLAERENGSELIKDVDEEETFAIKDGALIIEAIRSILCKHYGIFHPFQPLSEAVFELDPEEEGALKIVDTLNIEMIETEI